MSAKRKRKQPVRNTFLEENKSARPSSQGETGSDIGPIDDTEIDCKEVKTVEDETCEYWKLKYEKLLELRTTDVEEKLVDFNKKAEEQLKASDALVNLLESQLADMKMKLLTLSEANAQQEQANIQANGSQLSETTSHPTEPSRKMEAVIGFYNLLTGIALEQKNTSNTSDTFCCSFSNGPSSHAFMLHHDKVQQEIEFNPSVSEHSLTPRKRARSIGRRELPLPEFLNEDIYFEVKEAPRFLFRVLRSVHESQPLKPE